MSGRTRNVALVAVAVMGAFASELSAQVQLPVEFVQQLRAHGMTFDASALDGYTAVETQENPHMLYEFAARSPNSAVEVRFALRTSDGVIDEALAFATLLNVGDPNPDAAQLAAFDSDAVRDEFNAEGGVTGPFTPRETFSSEYDAGLMVTVWSQGQGMAYIFYLFRAAEVTTALAEVQRIFHAVRFR